MRAALSALRRRVCVLLERSWRPLEYGRGPATSEAFGYPEHFGRAPFVRLRLWRGSLTLRLFPVGLLLQWEPPAH